MRIVQPQRVDTRSATASTLTGRLIALRPTASDLIDAGFLLVLVAIGLLGFASTFSNYWFLAAGFVGALLGVLMAHLANVLRWHWLTVIAMAIAAFFALGGAIALRRDVVLGFLPSLATLAGLAGLSIGGWKGLLTTLPPVDGNGLYLVLPYLMGLLAGSAGFAVARRNRSPWAALITPVLFVMAVIALGTINPTHPVLLGAALAVVSFGWLVVRYTRRNRLAGTGMGNVTRWVSGALLLAVTLGAASLTSEVLPGHTRERQVARTYVQPPFEVEKYPSPLTGFRKYSSPLLNMLHDRPLVKVEGAEPGSLLRFAVLDDYSGMAWSATGGVAGDAESGFQRVGASVPGTLIGDRATLRLTIQDAYAATHDLNVWLPSVGPISTVHFEGDAAREHEEFFRYNLSTSQGVLPDRLRAGDVVVTEGVRMATDTGDLPNPLGTIQVAEQASAFMEQPVGKWSARVGDPWGKVQEVARIMRTTGYWSDGTRPDEKQYLPGHGQRRLRNFAGQLIGSDEQYAAAFALAANRLGYPARVVMGAKVPGDSMVRGKDVQAWVEIGIEGRGWVTVPVTEFSPKRDKHPQKVPPQVVEQESSEQVPPPNPARPPGSFDSLFNTANGADELEQKRTSTHWWDTLLFVLGIVGPPIGVVVGIIALILGLKALRRFRRRRRGTPTDQVAAGWREVLDRARDMGQTVVLDATRLEQARAVGDAEASELAKAANRMTFGPDAVSAESSQAFWVGVMTARKSMVSGLGRWKRWATALNPRSLVPQKRPTSLKLRHRKG